MEEFGQFQLNKVKNLILRNNKRKTHKKYVRPALTLQDKISQDPAAVKKRLKGFKQIDKEDYKYVKPGTFIRYLKKIPNGKYKYCHGGLLIVNADPVYWVLKSKQRGKDILWSVQLQSDNIYYRKQISEMPEKTMQDIYNAIKSGEYKLIKTKDLMNLINNSGKGVQLIDESSESYTANSDEESSTMESDDDSDDERRPTIVHLIH